VGEEKVAGCGARVWWSVMEEEVGVDSGRDSRLN